MTTVYIIRHAEIVYPLDEQGRKLMYPSETPISQDGRDQFTGFARSLKDNGVVLDVIASSSLTRTLETADILSREMGGIPVVKNESFTDSHVPGYMGIPLSVQQDIMDRGEDIYMHPRSPDQEIKEQIIRRMLAGFNDLVRKNEGKTVAIIGTGDPIRLLMYGLEQPQEEYHEKDIPSMSILSKEGYLKRGEAFKVTIYEGKILETELLSNLKGAKGVRELYIDSMQMRK